MGAPRAVQAAVVAALLGLAACGGTRSGGDRAAAPPASATPGPAPSTAPGAVGGEPSATTAAPPPAPADPPASIEPPARTTRPAPVSTAVPAPTTAPAPPEIVTVAYRVERRVDDDATAGFEDFVESVLSDGRGWERAAFDLVRTPDAPHLVVLAEGDEVDRLCLPYDTYGLYSCQNGPVVALNADRWRTATPKWTGDLVTYRAMLVNHEFGHLLGQRHPRVQCPARGRPAPIMAQQSTELDGCLPNPWPLDEEVERAARHDLPIAPPFSR